MARSNEPLVWSFFSAGGVLTAFLFPGLALAVSGWFGPGILGDYDAMRAAVTNPIVGAAITLILFVSLFHAMHRIRFVLFDLGVKLGPVLAIVCYGLALAGTAFAGYLLFGGAISA